MIPSNASAHSTEYFHCENCKQDFKAPVVTWVDISKTPQASAELLRNEFNIVRCSSCGQEHAADSPFFYEDFEAGLLIAAFSSVPENREEIEEKIGEKYAYYPHLEFLYDRDQLRMYIYLRQRQSQDANPYDLSRMVQGEHRLQQRLKVIRETPLPLEMLGSISESSRAASA